MRSELFRIPYELSGVPLFGFGVLLGLWLAGWLIALVIFSRGAEARAQPKPLRSLLANFGPLIALGAAIFAFLPRLFPDGLPIRGYGVMLLLAASTGLAMAVHRAQQRGLHADVIYSLAFWMFVAGIAGARLFFVIEYWDVAFAGETLLVRLQKAFSFTEGGLVVYGSLIGAAGVFAWRCWKEKLPLLAMADLLAPSLAIGLAIGRVGCLLNGCCYGGLCDRPWAVTFPQHHAAGSQEYSPPYGDQVSHGEMHGFRLAEDESTDPPRVVVAAVRDTSIGDLPIGTQVVGINGFATRSLDEARFQLLGAYAAGEPLRLQTADGAAVSIPAAAVRPRSLPVHPTQLYSATSAGLLGWFLWSYYPRRRRDGEVIGLLLSIYPVSRFLLEIIRTDESAFLSTGLSISQNVSLIIFVSMFGYWAWMAMRPRGVASFIPQPV